MSTYEALSLMIAFGTLIIALLVCRRHGLYKDYILHHDFTRCSNEKIKGSIYMKKSPLEIFSIVTYTYSHSPN